MSINWEPAAKQVDEDLSDPIYRALLLAFEWCAMFPLRDTASDEDHVACWTVYQACDEALEVLDARKPR